MQQYQGLIPRPSDNGHDFLPTQILSHFYPLDENWGWGCGSMGEGPTGSPNVIGQEECTGGLGLNHETVDQ